MLHSCPAKKCNPADVFKLANSFKHVYRVENIISVAKWWVGEGGGLLTSDIATFIKELLYVCALFLVCASGSLPRYNSFNWYHLQKKVVCCHLTHFSLVFTLQNDQHLKWWVVGWGRGGLIHQVTKWRQIARHSYYSYSIIWCWQWYRAKNNI